MTQLRMLREASLLHDWLERECRDRIVSQPHARMTERLLCAKRKSARRIIRRAKRLAFH